MYLVTFCSPIVLRGNAGYITARAILTDGEMQKPGRESPEGIDEGWRGFAISMYQPDHPEAAMPLPYRTQIGLLWIPISNIASIIRDQGR